MTTGESGGFIPPILTNGIEVLAFYDHLTAK
jgi:hypothetical protein